VSVCLLGSTTAFAATAVDLGVSAYTWTPDPSVNGGTSVFSVTVTNNDNFIAVPTTLTLVVNLPSNVNFGTSVTTSSLPAGCAIPSPYNTLTCTSASLAASGTWTVNFNGVGQTPGTGTTTATISAASNTDPNTGNDASVKNTTVTSGADLAVTTTGSAPASCGTGTCATLANSAYSFYVNVSNASGPNAATTFRVTDNLPATTDFTYTSATGTNWTCSLSGTTVTCDYTGGNIASGGSAPTITITGTVINTSGSVTNTATVASTDGGTGDPVSTNNTSSVVVNVTQTTDLLAYKTMVSAATGTTSFAQSEPVNLTLSVKNQGPRDATGVTITDIVPAGFTIGTLPSTPYSGCSKSGQTITCPVGALANGVTSSSFVIPLTSPSSSGSGTNTATPGRTTPSTGANTTASVNYTIAAATANLAANKTMISAANNSTTYAYNEAVTLTLSVTNNGPQNATGVTVSDPVPTGFVIGTLPSGCIASGQTITCTVPGTLNNSVTSANFVIPLTSPGTSSSGTNTATPGHGGTPTLGTNTPASVGYSVAAPAANLRANKAMVSAALGSTNNTTTYVAGMAVTLTLSATNLGLQDATGVTVTDIVPADFTIGSLPSTPYSGCSASGQTITCTVGALANGATSSNFVIPLTANSNTAGNTGSNTANVTRTGPSAGSNTAATVSYSIVAPYAHLTLTKTKTPALVVAGATGPITNTIVVTNSTNSSSTASSTIRVTDVLDANETFVSFSGTGWSCSGVAVGSTGTVTCDNVNTGNLARGAALPSLVITTQGISTYLGNLSNTACTGSTVSSPHTPADNSTTGNCVTATNYVSPRNVDLSIVKTASTAQLLGSVASFTYTLVVSNANATNVAPTVTVSDPLPGWVSGAGGTTGTAVITGTYTGTLSPTGVGTSESCTFGSTVTCTLLNLTNGSPRTITITVNRKLTAGSYTNIATVTTPDAIDTAGTKSGSVAIIIDPSADVLITAMSSAPNPVKVGVQFTNTTSIHNNGPDTAAGVVLRQVLDPTRMSYIAGSASLTVGGTCSYVSSFGAGSYAGSAGIECSGFTLTSGESRQLTFNVIPVYDSTLGRYWDTPLPANYTNTATITTTTGESDAPGYANNSSNNIVSVTTQAIDLSITNNDHNTTGTNWDPTNFGDYIVYQALAQNNGPSQATGFTLSEQPNAPAGSSPDPYTMVWDSAHTVMPPGYTGANCTQPGGVGTAVICYLGAGVGSSVLPASTSALFQIAFTTGPSTNAPASSITYSSTASVSSYETGGSPFSGDALPGNNSVTETTTVRPKTDLAVYSKTVSKPVVDLNETFTYTIVVGNIGPSIASGVRLTDALPAGLVAVGNVTVTAGSGVTLTAKTCDGIAWAGTCDLSSIPADTSGTDPTKMVTIAIPVRAAYQASGTYSFAFNTNITNTATIATLPNTSVDTVAGNNTNSVVVQVRKNSIAGYVYADNNIDNAMDGTGAEGVGSVTLTLTGMDSSGYTYGSGMNYAALTATTAGTGVSTGSFLFDNLPPGSWTVVETQPANYWDRYETIGNAAGTAPANTCDGSTNCAATAAANTISSITLPAFSATVATGYLFQEYQKAQISGIVYIDANNDGIKSGGSETGIPSATVTLSGTAYNGVNVCTLTTCATTTPTGTTGAYSYTNLPPADATGYTLTETQPGGYLNGKTTAGTATGTNSVAGTATGANSDVIQAIKVYSNGTSPNNNFGELQAATLNGYVFIDTLPATPDAVRSGTELSGIPLLTITLTGTDDLGGSVNTTATTGTAGLYSFTGLRPGAYTVTETTPPVGLTHTGAQAGSKGGTIGGSVRAASVGVTGSGNTAISAITLVSNDTAAGYNFGESGQGLSGYVYVDLNGNGTKDSSPTAEPGIGGATSGVYVNVTLSGTTISGQDVCVAIDPTPCTAPTNSSGYYSFIGLPASNGSGYTLTVQAQTSAPLTNYVAGGLQLGTGLATAGVAGTRAFTGIILPVGGIGANYNFGELGATLAGTVYYDANDDGLMNGADTGITNVTLTLSGTTASGANVCTTLTGFGMSCTITSGTGGTFSYSGLPAANATGYTLVETQPVDYANRTDTLGSACGGTCGTASVVGGNSQFAAIKLAAGANAISYLFGEKTGAISGFVYLDANNDGIMSGAGETGISGVTLTLSGTTASGAAVCTTCTTTTASDGSYSFGGVKNANGSGYTVTETQLGTYLHGKVTAGTQTGTVTNTAYTYPGTTAQNSIAAIAFSAASAATAYNFGQLQTTSISGFVYADINSNSTLESGEALGSVTLTLSGTNDQGTVVNTTTTTATDGTGAYTFTGLRPSNGSGYTVTETQPTGYGEFSGTTGTLRGTISATLTGTVALNATSAIVLSSGASAINYNFRENSSSIAGTVYVDANLNATLDSTDTRLSGVTVTLSGTATATTTTDASGNYSFTKLISGTYTVTETQPSGVVDITTPQSYSGTTVGTPAGGTAALNATSAIVLGAGVPAIGYNFREQNTSALSGKVYVDANNSGVYVSGETQLQGVTVTLSGTTTVGAINVCTLITSCTASTDSSGNYTFGNLPAGTYTLTETQPTAYGDGKESAGSPAGTVNNTAFSSASTYNQIASITLTALQAGSGYDFGEIAASVAGTVYLDVDNSGTYNTGDTLIAGVTVALGGAATASTTTDASGNYSFTGLVAGTYTVTETQPVNYADRTNAAGTSGGTVGVNTMTGVALVAGVAATGYLFGEKAGAISGTVYLDANNNGVQDAGETTGIGSVGLLLTGTAADGTTVVSKTATTAGNGTYSFTGLLNANASGYTITETQPSGYLDGLQRKGQINGASTCGNPSCLITVANVISAIPLNAANTFTLYDFGELQTTSISGFVYADINNSNALDSGEALAGVTLTLSGTNDQGTVITPVITNTNASGAYGFTGLRPSNTAGYTVTESQPTGYADYSTNTGTQVGTITSVSTGSSGAGANVVSAIVLSSGASAINYNFRENSSSIAGTVYVDANLNATLDSTDTRLSGVTVTLSGTATATTTTDASGNYSFTKLISGTYTVTETQPSGVVDFSGNTGTAVGTPAGGTAALNATSAIVLGAGVPAAGYNFREQNTSTVSGKVYVDANNDGVYQTGEIQLANVTVTLSGATTAGAVDVCTLITSCTAVSDSSGNYTFSNLPAGTFTLTETQPLNYYDGKESAGSPAGTVNNAAFGNTSATNQIASITLTAQQGGTNYNFGEIAASVAGTVYLDVNNDGLYNTGDTLISGVAITLSGTTLSGADLCTTLTSQGLSCSTSTAAGGTYSFTGLPASNSSGYTVTEITPVNYAVRTNTAGTSGGTAAVGGTTITAVNLATGVAATGYLFGEKTGAISGIVYLDVNNDGIQSGSGETGIGSVTLTLTGTAKDGTTSVSGTTTSSLTDGSYSFANLPNANTTGYTITETQPTLYLHGKLTAGTQSGTVTNTAYTGSAAQNSIAAIAFSAASTATAYNFGELQSTSISGFVYQDVNNNSTLDSGEALASVTLTLSGTNDQGAAVNTTATTDSTGAYSFLSLRPSNSSGYTVTETQPAGYGDFSGTTGTLQGTISGTPIGTVVLNATSAIVLNSAAIATGYNFRENSSSIAGTVYVDVNLNGTLDSPPDTKLSGVIVTLSGTTSTALNICSVIASCTATTDASGNYSFAKLLSGTYTVTETQPTGVGDFSLATGTAVGTAGGTAALNVTSAIALGAGVPATGYNFREQNISSLSGKVYIDTNNNGIPDTGELGIQGVTLNLTGATTATATTDASGNYTFTGLQAGTYTLTEIQPSAYADGKEGAGSPAGTVNNTIFNNTAAANQIASIVLGMAQNGTGYNFGELMGSLSGTVYSDLNANGVLDGTEPGIPTVTVTLTGTDTLNNPVSRATTTDANGNYSYTGLLTANASGYTVTVTQPTGWLPGQVAKGLINAVACPSCDTTTVSTNKTIPYQPGSSFTGFNFGEVHSTSLAGFVYADINNNSTLDSGEALVGVTLTLSGTDDLGATVNQAVNTIAGGAYLFTGLRPSGTVGYTVTETQPGGYADFSGVTGTAVGTISGTATGTAALNSTSAIVLSSGATAINYNFRESSSSFVGKVYIDTNNNGTPDAGEAGIAGVTVTLSGTATTGADICSVIATCIATTDASGNYSFTKLLSGSYTLTETQPPAYGDGKESAGTPAGTVNNSAFGATAATNMIASIPLLAGQGGVGYNFGELLGSISGTVYNDVNANGLLDTGEPGIASVVLTLTGTDSLGAAVSKTSTTDANGVFSFTGLLTANGSGYTITETQPTGWMDGQLSKGLISSVVCAACDNTTTNTIKSIPFQPDSTFTAFNFGEVQNASIAGTVYHDVNKNGTKDAGEAGLGSVTLTLVGTDYSGAAVSVTMLTAADGSYIFSGLRPSNTAGYTVTETQPTGVNDFPGSSGTHLGTFGGTVALNQVTGIVVGSGAVAVSYHFREDASVFANGLVYLDANDDGIHQASEAGIPNVIVTLTASGGGRCGDGTTSCTATTAADGSFSFSGLRAGTYTMTETQPSIYEDGKETAGTLGGTVNNVTFGSLASQNQISNMVLAAGTPASGYMFADLAGVRAIVSGRVWINTAASGTKNAFDPGDTPLQGWIIELIFNNAVLASTNSAADGTYFIDTVTPNYNYSVAFKNPANGITWAGPVVNGGDGTANKASISGITVPTGGNVVGLDLPIDPSGVIYDAVTRAPVKGAVVNFVGADGVTLVSTANVLGGVATQTTGVDGLYQYFLTNTAPTGVYGLSVTAPPGYLQGVSALIPPTAGAPLDATGASLLYIQAQDSPPTGNQSTKYYLSFKLAQTSGGVFNNHIPVDPVPLGSIVMTKSTPLINVAKGDLVPYTLTATNVVSTVSTGVNVLDQMPPGFKYRTGSANLNGIALEPTVSGRVLTWPNLTFTPSEKKTFKLMLMVGSGVGQGQYTNQTWAVNSGNGTTISNVASVVVKVVPDPTFDCSDLVGKVFDDRNANGYQDQGEPGIPNVRVATVRGLLVTTDAEGRFHVACADIPQAGIGSNFIMKLDDRTLPSGFRVTTENPRVVRTTKGTLVKLNFGATIHKVFRLELDGRAFAADGKLLLPDWDSRLKALVPQLTERPSVLRIAYRAAGDAEDLIFQRIAALEKQVKELYKKEKAAKKDVPPLLIETEIFGKTGEQK
jgi:uncharacterized repeat protein (TIGR01451 family)